MRPRDRLERVEQAAVSGSGRRESGKDLRLSVATSTPGPRLRTGADSAEEGISSPRQAQGDLSTRLPSPPYKLLSFTRCPQGTLTAHIRPPRQQRTRCPHHTSLSADFRATGPARSGTGTNGSGGNRTNAVLVAIYHRSVSESGSQGERRGRKGRTSCHVWRQDRRFL